MTAGRRAATVVVGVDRDSAGNAVEWAAAEAAARRAPLLVVNAFRCPLTTDPYGLIPVAERRLTAAVEAEQVLCTAARRARSVVPDLEIAQQLLLGAPSRVLLEQSRQAALLVLGGRRRGAGRRMVTGSVSGRVAARACCPVVVIRSRPAVRSGTTGPNVVVGVGDTPSCIPAIAFAFRAARQRGIPLTAVHAWRRDVPADAEAVTDCLGASEARARENLDRVVRHWQDEFPDVHAKSQVVCADPAAALIGESVGASLVVVGSRSRGAARARLFGSVSRSVIWEAHSPVAVVRPDGPVPTRSAERLRNHRPTDAC